MLHCCSQRGLAFRRYPLDGLLNACGFDRSNIHQGLNIPTVALAPMTVGDQPKAMFRRPIGDQIAEDLTRNRNLVLSIDLAPHAARGIHDDHNIVGAWRWIVMIVQSISGRRVVRLPECWARHPQSQDQNGPSVAAGTHHN